MALETKKISFRKESGHDFLTELRKKINLYFAEKELSPKANSAMYLKSIFLMGLVSLVYTALLLNLVGGWGVAAIYILLGFLVAIGTMNIAHDALHGAYTAHGPGNRMLGLLMDLSGASSFYWKKEHTVDHHTFTNIAEHDADLKVPILLRLCPQMPYRSFHRFQHLYAPFLYSLNLIHWIYFSDLKRIYHIFKNLRSGSGNPPPVEIALLLSFKILHLLLFLAIPMLCLSIPWWQVALGYIGYLATAGATVTLIFQLAHIVENVAFPLPDVEGKIENSFAKHQLSTTSNFATRSRLVGFLFGGLNFQVEHHILPHICHIHLRQISPIVQSTAKEFGLPYHENPSFFSAVRSHFRTLKKLGHTPPES